MHLVALLVFGLLVGLLARAFMPGTQAIGVLGTMALGMTGSLLGGFLGRLLIPGDWQQAVTAGWIGSIAGTLIVLAVLQQVLRTR